MQKDNAPNLFIAAAGMGTRLQPLTHAFPKPLLPVAGIPVIERLLHPVAATLGMRAFAMNLHHMPELFRSWTESLPPYLPRPVFYHEQTLLGTGGAIANAHEFFRQGTCLLINGDILTDIDWEAFFMHHRSSGNMVTLALQDRTHERRVGVDASGKLVCIDPEMKTKGVGRWLGYACAAIYEPAFLDFLPTGESHVPPFWVAAAEKTHSVGTYDIGSSQWIDLGTVDSYAHGIIAALKGHQRFFAERLMIPWDTDISNVCVIEKNVTIGAGASLSNVVLLPGSRIEDGESLESVISGPGFRAPFNSKQEASRPQADRTILSGSDRIYTHVKGGLLLEYSASEALIQRQILLTRCLRQNGIPVPEVYSHVPEKRQVLLQDLGDESLQTWCQSHPVDALESMLKRVLDRLVDFQWSDTTGLPYPQDKPFDKSVLLWESSYFLERCVFRAFGLREFCRTMSETLSLEFERLADSVAMLPRNLMHRDFQSSNVMIYHDAPWFIDFQAAHHGPCFYDAASLIGDPYLDLPRDLRQDLESHYLDNVIDRLEMTREDARNALIQCGIQRHMQALGAYGFLSAIQGKPEFLKYIPPALRLLREQVVRVEPAFPCLYRLLGESGKRIAP